MPAWSKVTRVGRCRQDELRDAKTMQEGFSRLLTEY